VADDVNGRLLPAAASAGEFARAVHQALADPLRRGRWHIQAIQTARRHSRRVCSRKLAELYRQVLQRAQSVTDPSTRELGPLDNLVARIRLEWTLFSGKIKSAVEATSSLPPSDSAAPSAPE
jgi:hypothetical protein